MGREGNSETDFYRGNPTCPRCGGADTIALEEPWWECVTQRVREVIPEYVAGQQVPIYGRCGHRFDVEEVAARKRAEAADTQARKERERKAGLQRQRDEREAGEIERALVGIGDLRQLDDLLASARERADRWLSVPRLQAAWQRLVEAAAPGYSEELVAMTARPNFLGQLQKRTKRGYGSQWGSWRETERLPIYPEREDCDGVRVDSAGRLWRQDPYNEEEWARRIVFNREDSMTHWITVPRGTEARIRRGRELTYSEITSWSLGPWWVRFDAPTALQDRDVESTSYCRALRSVIAGLQRDMGTSR
jgi:hypothetical protein